MTAKVRTDRSRRLALYVLCVGVLMIVLDTTIVNVALPSIQTDLHFSDSGPAWVVNSYLIAFGGLLLLAVRIGDLFGRRRVFLTGLVIFTGLTVIGAGLAVFAQAPGNSAYLTHVLPPMVLLGTGAGLAFPALMTLGMSDTAPQDAGLASGLLNTSAQVGGALGLAVLATVSASRSARLAATGTATADALTGGYHLAFWIGTALIGAAIGVAVVVLRDREEPVAPPVGMPVGIEAAEQVTVG